MSGVCICINTIKENVTYRSSPPLGYEFQRLNNPQTLSACLSVYRGLPRSLTIDGSNECTRHG